MTSFLHDVNPEDGLDGLGGGLEGDLESAFERALEVDTSKSSS